MLLCHCEERSDEAISSKIGIPHYMIFNNESYKQLSDELNHDAAAGAFSENALMTAARPRAGSAKVRTNLPAGALNIPSSWARTTGSGGISAKDLTC
jgi:hypothetical protein